MYSIVKKQQKRQTLFHKQKKVLILCSPVLLISTLLVLEITNKTHIFHKRKAISSTIQSTDSTSNNTTVSDKATDTGNNLSSSQQTPTSQAKDDPPSVSSSAGPIAPYGNFVSNHSPGEDGSSTAEQSVCITTPGASCTITFTNADGVTKTLNATAADSNGAVYWNWDVNKAGFTTGSWQIIATAILNGQSKTTKDEIPLKVQ